MKIIKGQTGVLRLHTDRKFVEVNTQKDKLIIQLTDSPDFSKICYSINYINPEIVLPNRIMLAYDIRNKGFFIYDEETEQLVCSSKRNGGVLKPIDSRIKGEFELPNLNLALSVTTKKVINGRYSLKTKEWFPGRHEVCIAAGKNNFMREAPCSTDEKIYSMQEIKEEYGSNFYQYPYDTLRYAYDEKESSKKAYYTKIPVTFLRKWDEDYCGNVELFCMPDGKNYACPPRRVCDFDDEVIEPMYEEIQTVEVCEDCHENKEEIGDVIRLISNLLDTCKSISEQNTELKNRINTIEKAVFN